MQLPFLTRHVPLPHGLLEHSSISKLTKRSTLFIYLFIYLFVCSFVRLFVCLFVYLLIYLFIYYFLLIKLIILNITTIEKNMNERFKLTCAISSVPLITICTAAAV